MVEITLMRSQLGIYSGSGGGAVLVKSIYLICLKHMGGTWALVVFSAHPTSSGYKNVLGRGDYIMTTRTSLQITQPRGGHRANYSFAFY